MINNNTNTTMPSSSSPSSTATNAQSPGLKTYFKTPEGRYKLQYEKTHPTSFVHFPLGKTITQVNNLLTISRFWNQPISDNQFWASTHVVKFVFLLNRLLFLGQFRFLFVRLLIRLIISIPIW